MQFLPSIADKSFPAGRIFAVRALAAATLTGALLAAPASAQAPSAPGQMTPTTSAAPAPPVPAPAPAAPSAPAPGPAGEPAPAPQAQAKPKPKPKPKPAIREWALSDDPTPSFQPETFYATVAASERYAAIADMGGWPTVPGNVGPGSPGKTIAVLRKRLAIEGDLPEANAAGEARGEAWDETLAAAVRRFQGRHGLRKSGVVSGSTLRAMNVPARVRFKQLASSAQRLAGNTFGFGDRYVVVNIPSAAVEAIENGRVVKRYVAVVGDVDHRSPEVESKISAVNVNPTWTAPTSIIKNEIIPKMRRDPGYLSRARIRILDGRGNEVHPGSIDWNSERAVNYTLRQDSGAHNSLGALRIQMPNKHAVYMHDTPSKGYFGRDYRFLSHGCVRVQGVADLAAWLLGPQWDGKAVLQQVAKGERQDLKLSQSVPVIWVYMTGWASADGAVHFADDVYQVDTIGLQASAN